MAQKLLDIEKWCMGGPGSRQWIACGSVSAYTRNEGYVYTTYRLKATQPTINCRFAIQHALVQETNNGGTDVI